MAEPRRPDVVVVVFDDVGFADFGCYGSEIETPTLDRLADAGLRYTNFHTTALCSPTRACVLTGRNHHSVGMGSLAGWDLGHDGARGRLAPEAATMAEILRTVGYRTFATGKWHLTPISETSGAGPYENWPVQRGFDRYYGFLDGETNQWKPELTYDNHRVDPPDTDGYHVTADIIDRSIEFVGDLHALAPDDPYLLYVGFGACHGPHHVPAEYIDKYEPVFDKGWDRTRADRLARQRDLGMVPSNTELSEPHRSAKPWNDLAPEAQRLFTRMQAAYAGMLDHADEHLGRLVDFLGELGRFDDTIFIVISDNGATLEGSPVGTINATRMGNRLRDSVEANLEHIDEIGQAHLNNHYPLGWAMAGNTPLKRFKQNTHGGGVRDPLIVSWPNGPIEAGGIRHQFCHAIDLLPTVLESLGVDAPESIQGLAQEPIEGVGLAYTFDDAGAPTAKAVQYFEMMGHRGIWADGWKAVTFHDSAAPFEADVWELYHLDVDFSETHDLAAERPDKLAELVALWNAEAERYGALPLDGRSMDERFLLAGQERPLRYVLRPSTSHLPTDAAPDIRNRSYRITASIDVPAEGVSGVLVAHGDTNSGYAFYVDDDGRLVHEYNASGARTLLRSTVDLAPGAYEVEYRFAKTSDCAGDNALVIDGDIVATGRLEQTLPFVLAFEGLDVGRNRLMPAGTYEAPFPFTGTINTVIYDLDDDQNLDPAGAFAADLHRQ